MEDNKNISQIALEKIKESGIKPISKNIFNLKRVLFWSLVGFSIIIGVISFSSTLSILFYNDWYLYNKLGFGFIIKSLPYFWFIFLLIFAILCEFYYRKTSFGYRHRIVFIIGIYVSLIIVFGSILHLIGMGEKIEQSLFKNVPVYHFVTFDRNEFWSNPREGFISGRIILVDNNMIKIIDQNRNVWVLNIENASVRGRIKMTEGEVIKIIGEIKNNVFIAEEIRPWMGRSSLNCCMAR
ncbi:MAG: hypothetical protein WC603_00475 [Candidatus Paceibacterota bacterium]|jgi:hypothetical protein